MSGGNIWKLTELGRKRAGSIYSDESSDALLAYLRECPRKNPTASLEELANVTGKTTSEVRSLLRKLEGRGLVESLGGY